MDVASGSEKPFKLWWKCLKQPFFPTAGRDIFSGSKSYDLWLLSYQFTDMVVRWLAQQESPGFIHIFVQRHAYRLTSDSKWMDDVCVNFKQGDVIRVKTDDITGYALVRVWLAKSPPHGLLSVHQSDPLHCLWGAVSKHQDADGQPAQLEL